MDETDLDVVEVVELKDSVMSEALVIPRTPSVVALLASEAAEDASVPSTTAMMAS